jgi:GTPase SAR1 family protein
MARAAEWNELSEEMRGSSLVSRLDISEVLREKHIVVLAEPGAGKSTWIHAAVLNLLDQMPDSRVPIYAQLGSYTGSLKVLLDHAEGYSKLEKPG